MVQMLFFLRFKNQLRRTRPELVVRLEDSLSKAVVNAGGKIIGARRLFSALFDEQSLGFWLDMLILIETVLTDIEAEKEDLYGYSLVLGRSPGESSAGSFAGFSDSLCRFLAGVMDSGGFNDTGLGGVFLDGSVRKGLLPYVTVEGSDAWLAAGGGGRMAKKINNSARINIGGFYRLTGLCDFGSAVRNRLPAQETIAQSLASSGSALVLGPPFTDKRSGLYRYCENAGISPLSIRFGAGGINALIDAWSARIRAMVPSGGNVEEINNLWELLFRERLRDELSVFIVRSARRFFSLLLGFYISAARARGRTPAIVLENIHQAEKTAADIFIEGYTGLKNSRGLLILGTGENTINDENLRKWERVFPRVINLNIETVQRFRPPEMPGEIWEIAYAFSLFGRYYPADFFQRLFEEENKNPAMISRALSLLSAFGLTDSPRESRPEMEGFVEQAEAALGENAGRVRAMVRGRLLSWVEQRKLSPCFRLLLILAELGGAANITDQLMLKAISSDLANGTSADIVRAGALEELAGPERAAAVRFIFETLRALLSGGENEIRAAFKDPPPDCASFPVFKAQILVNLSACHLGLRDNVSALETVKEAILLSQGKNNLCLPQSYRLFSLVSLADQKTGEAIDYLGFAMENAEKNGNYQELCVSAYYAAAAQFLFGNVFKAAELARKARERALAAARPEWADRSRFLEGRLAFETGRYQEALEIFENLRKEPFNGMSAEKDQLLAAWAYRSRVYFRNPLSPKPESGGHDADLFEVEASYLAGNYRKTAELSGVLTNPHIRDNFLYTEQPDWRSGFAQCELLYFSRGELWDRMICVYRSMALCRLSASGGEEAMHNMQRILRSEQPSEMDPWDAFYFYSWYCILEQTGAGQADMSTAVSMAFKRLRRRAGRIDDIETRRQYLSRPRWNGALSQAAREFKLI